MKLRCQRGCGIQDQVQGNERVERDSSGWYVDPTMKTARPGEADSEVSDRSAYMQDEARQLSYGVLLTILL